MTTSVRGLVGIVTRRPGMLARNELRQMLSVMRHRLSDRNDFFVDEKLGIYLGWITRSCSAAASMPLYNETRSVALVTSGEDFPEPGIMHQIKTRGHDLSMQSSAHLVHLYEEEASFPASLNGRFHGFLLDYDRSVAMLYNDRYGIHRIYYYETEDSFYFAAEAKTILAVCPELRSLDLQSLGEFISCGAVLENRTLFQGLRVLPGASKWEFRDGALSRKTSYFHPSEWEQQEPLPMDDYYAHLREAFTTNLPRYFSGPQSIGMSLTGGLDTRMILAHLSLSPGLLPCYTFGSMYRDNEDVHIARRVAQACHHPHQVITAGEEFLSQFSEYAEETIFLSDGCVDVSRSPDLYLNELACQVAPVRMTGNYGGEVLRGVRGFKPVPIDNELYSREMLPYLDESEVTYAKQIHEHPVTFAAFRQAPWYNYGILSIEETQLSMRTPFLDNDLIRAIYRSPIHAFASNDVSLRIIADGNPALLRIPTDRGISPHGATPLQAVQHSVLEFLFKAEYAYDMGMPQWLAKFDHAFSSLHLERLFLGRHKPFHFRVWYRDKLNDYVKETLLDRRSLCRGLINDKKLKAMVDGHLSGTHNYTTELHKLLTLELIQRIFIDSSPGSCLAIANEAVTPLMA